MLRSIREIDPNNISGKKILVRVDYNVPIKDGNVLDDTRIKRSLPTLNYLMRNNCNIIIISHLGRPKGEIKPELSLAPVAIHLSALLKEAVEFCDETVGDKAKEVINNIGSEYRIVLLENTRFNKGEKKNAEGFAKELASYADIFVSDAFGTVHRAHASTVGVSNYLEAYAGMLVEEEYSRITKAMISPKKPSIAIVGGAKVSTKLDVINNFIEIMDTIIIGGGMTFTFLRSMGKEVGNSLIEEGMIDTASQLLVKAKERGVNILLPVDFRLSRTFDEPLLENGIAKISTDIPKDAMGLDIGPESEKLFVKIIEQANTIIWNGPMGVFETELYLSGTKSIAESVVRRNVETIIGGGDTAFALSLAGITDIPASIHVSTGGGASLELLSGQKLPGLECLKK